MKHFSYFQSQVHLWPIEFSSIFKFHFTWKFYFGSSWLKLFYTRPISFSNSPNSRRTDWCLHYFNWIHDFFFSGCLEIIISLNHFQFNKIIMKNLKTLMDCMSYSTLSPKKRSFDTSFSIKVTAIFVVTGSHNFEQKYFLQISFQFQ